MELCTNCNGKGCLDCNFELMSRNKSSIAPTPAFIANPNDKNDMELLKNAIGKDALDKAFSNDGGGLREIELNLVSAKLSQALGGNRG